MQLSNLASRPLERSLALTTALALGACVVDGLDEPDLSTEVQEASSYKPMGFARVASTGVVGDSFNSESGGTVFATRSSAGRYRVNFTLLATSSIEDSSLGNVQVVAEGTDNVRCQLDGTTTSFPTLTVHVDCHAADSTFADSAFAVLFYRYVMPAPNSFVANHAYTMIDRDGTIPTPRVDYNSSGTHNSATRTGVGSYTVTIPNALSVNASVMVTAADYPQPGNVCSVTFWGAGSIQIQCRDRFGNLDDTRFSLSYAVSGPTHDQQGAHAWFNGAFAHTTYSAAYGMYSWCSPASVSAGRSGSLATVVVSGDLGSWDATPFVHVPFASTYGSAGYCKIESSTSSGAAPSWTGTSTVRCYSATGAVAAQPMFTFTDVTNNPAGPC
jgi:hypothetical protein